MSTFDLDAFVQAHHASLRRRAYLLTGCAADAEDLAQEALARAWLASRDGRDLEHPRAYVERILVNLCLSRWRRRRRRPEVLAAEPAQLRGLGPSRPGQPGGEVSPGADAGVGERAQMWQALSGIPERQRAVLVLRYYEDLPESQVADLLGVSIGTVRSQTWKALRRLRAHFDDQAEEDPGA